jgi:hypothetical protein
MNLQKEKLVPLLEMMGYTTIAGTGVWKKQHEDSTKQIFWGVDFRKNEVFKWVEDHREYDVPGDKIFEELKIFVDGQCGKDEPETEVLPAEDKTSLPDPYNEPMSETSPVNTALPTLANANIVRPAISATDAAIAWQEYQDMRNTILAQSDFHRIQNKDFIKKSGWRKFATFYNLTDVIAEENRITVDDKEFIWKIKVVCTAPNGRQTEGVAMCSSKEKSGARIDHDVYSTAHTRAKNRAISDMIAAGEVSAEEVSE